MDFSRVPQRTLMVAVVVALGAGTTVYLLDDWFHDFFAPTPLVDAIGTAVIVMIVLIGQHLLSITFYKDHMLGMSSVLCNDAGKLENFHKVAEEISGELKQVRDFNEVLRGQLQSVIDETEKSAFNIVERLETIDSVVTKLDRFVAGTASEAAQLVRDSETRIVQNQNIISQLSGYVQQRLHEAEQDQLRVTQVVSEARSLESLVQLIKHVAGQTNLLALNAAIESARAGEAGRGFAVVADEVRKLSGETETAVSKISQGISSVANNIHAQFQHKISSMNLDNERQMLEFFSSQLNALGQSYEALIQHESAVLAEVQESSKQLGSMFLDTQASVQFQDLTRQQIELVMQALTKLDEHAGLLAQRLGAHEDSGLTYTPIAQHLESLYSGYVMEEQRSTHQRLASATKSNSGNHGSALPAPAASRIELF